MKLKCLLTLAALLAAQANATSPFTNPILGSGADPWIIRSGGFYYYMQTDGGLNIRKSSELASPLGVENASPVSVFTPPAPYNQNVWAPELHYINGNWYIYYTAGLASDPSDTTHRIFCAEADTQDPMGTYTFKGKVYDSSHDYWAIDPTVYQKDDGTLYMAFCSRASSGNDGVSRVYIAPMSNPYTISGPRVLLTSPTYSWEANINEAPEFIKHNGTVNLVYSANCACGNNYCLGLLANNDGNLLNAGSWTKNSTPIFQTYTGSDGNCYAPGHCSFTTSVDGTEDWIVFHTAQYSGSGFIREVHTQPFSWTPGFNTPSLGHPIPSGEGVPLPSGEDASREKVVLRNDGVIAAVGAFTDSVVRRSVQTSSNGPFTDWTSLGGVGFKAVSAACYPDNRLAVFGVGNSPVWFNTETSPGGSWSGWASLSGPSFSSVSGTLYSDSRAVVAAVGNGTSVQINAQNANGTWGGWGNLGGSGFWNIDLVRRPDDSLVVFGVGTASVWVDAQIQANGSWGGWSSIGGSHFNYVRAVLRPDGSFVAFACGNGTDVQVNAQAGYQGSWTGWQSLGGSGFTRISPVLKSDGSLVVFGTGAAGSLWIDTQNGYQGSWSGWQTLGGSDFGTCEGLIYPDDRLAVFAHDYSTVEYFGAQNAPNGTWNSPTNISTTWTLQ